MRNIYLFTILALFFSSCESEDYPPSIISSSYQEIKDTSYSTDVRNKMDLYLPENRSPKTNIILMIHGGAWISGDKSDLNPSITAIRALDPSLAIANINYRYVNGTSVLIEDQIKDVEKAVKFLVNNSSKLNISTNIAVVGASSGSHIGMMYAYKYDSGKNIKSVGNYFGPTRIDSKEWYDSFSLGLFKYISEALYPLFGQNWNEQLYSSYSPYAVVTKTNGKPTISFHGGLDPVVPKDHSKDLNAKLKSLSIPSEYHEYPNSLHILFDNDLKDSYPKLISFINKHW